MAGCAIIEGLVSFWPISEITVADRGIREGILLDMMHASKHNPDRRRKHSRYPYGRNRNKNFTNSNGQLKGAAND